MTEGAAPLAPGPPPGPPPRPPRVRRKLVVDESKLSPKERYTQSQRREVDRVLTRAFRMNPYDILDLTQDADEKTIQKSYRKKSLLIHPDKMTEDQARAEEAFDLLKKSLDHLLDENRRKALDETVTSARCLALRELGLPMTLTNEEIELEKVPGGRLDQIAPSFEDRIKIYVKDIVLDEELKKRKAIQHKQEAEIEAAKLRMDAEEERKRRAELDTAWEEAREDRVQGWRSFNKTTKRRKKGPAVLG
ncbi:J domain-containing protein spf31 [Malassezia restricta CBS 7877]|uniref:J domain-containing protein spf31 n=1 Tax=Malassezia restricta (strain ATCC 96810 / NBRC 103918 / CBS 7877) TaxID=425264 RepID=A0A3G2S240_MALR7|nr:J domain-containing protein spf31 [Malassezia restricta CBS 7877]